MEKLRKIIYTILSTIAVVVAVGSLLSIFRNTESRFLKMLDFPRIQFFIASLISLILFIIFTKRWQWYDYLLTLGLACGIIIHGSYLVNYTKLVSTAVSTVKEKDYTIDDQISVLLANVKMSNRTSKPLLDLIKTKEPDLIIVMEVDDWWENQLKSIEKDYSFSQETINNVAYGMTLYSKYPLRDIKVNYLQNENVPSFESSIQLKNGKTFILHSVHPVPPTLFEDFPDNAGKQEVTMLKIGNKVEESKLPAIIAGDINDVSWGQRMS